MIQQSDIRFLAEGYVEEKILNFFKIPNNEILNTNTISKISNTMQKIQQQNYLCCVVALVDDDKNKYAYLENFSTDFEGNVFIENANIKKHPEHEHYLVIVSPAMEKWLIYLANKNDINCQEFDFNDFEELKTITKNVDVLKHEKFNNFLTLLLDKSEDFQKMKSWLKNLRKKALNLE